MNEDTSLPGPPALAGLRVLVVEDDLLITLLLEDSLTDLGCEVVGPASSVAGAVKLIRELPIDAALLDLHLSPDETGYGVAEALAALSVPFAFVTGYDAGWLREDYRDRPTLQKPFSADTLETLLLTLAEARVSSSLRD